jgi:hypothetical protein
MPQPRKEVAPVRRVALGLVGMVQATLAFLAFWDLTHRPAEQVRGPKPMWVPIILINWIGPLAYFFVHRHR